MGGRLFIAVVLAVLGAAAGACSGRDGPTDSDLPPADQTRLSDPTYIGPYATGDFLFQVGRALDSAGTYRLTAKQDNFVLARWGGSDGGTVSVDLKEQSAVADLRRTGDGQYAVVLTAGETYFRRETCPTWAKLQDGRDVLAAFVLTSDELTRSKLIDVVPSSPSSATSVVRLNLEGLGPVTMEVEKSTSRPVRIGSNSLTNNGKTLEWSFDRWGEKVEVPSISADKLSGPGGNPC